MLTREEIEKLNLGTPPLDIKTEIVINAGVEWLLNNTTLTLADISQNSGAKLFLLKFMDIQNMQTGVSSESIEGLSQSFNTGNNSELLWDIADSLLGGYVRGSVRFVSAEKKWK